MHSTIIPRVFHAMGLRVPQSKFLSELLLSWLTVQGRFNITNVSRYCLYNERSLRRWFSRSFNWTEFNSRVLSALLRSDHEIILAIDATFVSKSGKMTEGLGWFWHGMTSRAEKGLEASVISLVDMVVNTAYALDVKQTKSAQGETAKTGSGLTRIDQALNQLQAARMGADQSKVFDGGR